MLFHLKQKWTDLEQKEQQWILLLSKNFGDSWISHIDESKQVARITIHF